MKGVSDKRHKWELLLGSFDQRHLKKVERHLTQLGSQPYSQIKQALILAYTPSKEQDINELLYHTQLGDRKPSDLLEKMRKLLETDNTHLLKKLFLDKLDTETRRLLATVPQGSLDELAELCRPDCCQNPGKPLSPTHSLTTFHDPELNTTVFKRKKLINSLNLLTNT